MISRYVGFPNTAPVAASTLIDAVHKKYGPENPFANSRSLVWAYDASGKQLTGSLTQEVGQCVPLNPAHGFPVEMRGGTAITPGSRWGGFSPISIQGSIDANPHRQPKCAPYTFVEAHDLARVAPNTMTGALWVSIFSDTLLSRSLPITDAYLKKAAEDKVKQQEDAAKQRSAPKL